MEPQHPDTGCFLVGLVTVVMVLFGAIVAATLLQAHLKDILPW